MATNARYEFVLIASNETRVVSFDDYESWSRLVIAAGAVKGEEPKQRSEVRGDAKVQVAELRTGATFADAVTTMEQETGERFPSMWPTVVEEPPDTLLSFEQRFPDALPAPDDPLSDEAIDSAESPDSLEAALAAPDDVVAISRFSLDTLPDELTQFPRLRTFSARIDDATLPGPLANLPLLRRIWIGGYTHRLTSEIGLLTALRELSTRGIESLPAEIGALRMLRELEIRYGSIVDLPLEIGYLIELARLTVDHCALERLPPSLARLKKLRILELASNRLRALPTALGTLEALEFLDVSYNPVGALPESIGELATLHTLKAVKCGLSELPATIANCESLRVLELALNTLTASAFDALVSTSIESLDLRDVAIPDNARLPTTLTSLRWSALGFDQCTLPCAILEASRLSRLDLEHAGLCELPDALFDLPLRSLNLGFNKDVVLPDSIRRLSGLEFLSLYALELTEVPDVLASLPIQKLHLGANRRIERLPEWLHTMPTLRELCIGDSVPREERDRFIEARPDVKLLSWMSTDPIA